jgi:hypothetical protein
MYTIQSGNTILIADRVQEIDLVPSSTKQFYVRAPYIFKERPVVTITISADVNESTPKDASIPPFLVYGIEEFKATGETAFKVSAINLDVTASNPNIYWCDFTMTGELES